MDTEYDLDRAHLPSNLKELKEENAPIEEIEEPKPLSLWQLVQLKIQLDEKLTESGGEITEEIDQLLTVNNEDLALKLDAYYHVIQGLEHAALYWKQESAKMKAIEQGFIASVDRLKDRINQCMTEMGTKEIKGLRTAFTQRPNPPALIIEDIGFIPEEFKTQKITMELDKERLKEVLKAGGHVSGAKLGIGSHLRIKLNK